MTRLVIDTFEGMQPRLAAEALDLSAATLAVATRSGSTNLRPWLDDVDVHTLPAGTIKTLYRFGQDLSSETQYWFQFAADVDVVRSPVHSDAWERTYFTGVVDVDNHTYMRYAYSPPSLVSAPYPAATYKAGVPQVGTPNYSVTGSAGTNEVAETRFYVVTWVTSFGEEGPASDPSPAINVFPSQTVQLLWNAAPTGYNITKARVYRTNVGTNVADFQFVTELNASTSVTNTYNDSKLKAELGEVLPSRRWFAPPRDLIGLTSMANGILIGFVKGTNQLCFSEPYMPHAWDPNNYLTTDHPIVAVRAFGQSAVVLTQSFPYIVTGIDPSGMSMAKLDSPQACVSKRSACVMAGGVVYASPDGVVRVDAAGNVNLLTANILAREQWQQYKPESMQFATHDDKLFAFYDTGTERDALVFDMRGDMPRLSRANFWSPAVYQEPLNDALYYVGASNTKVRKWGAAATYKTLKWKSKTFLLSKPQTLTSLRVFSSTYADLYVTVYADGSELLYRRKIFDNSVYRLPVYKRYTRVEVMLEGAGMDVAAVVLASSPQECVR